MENVVKNKGGRPAKRNKVLECSGSINDLVALSVDWLQANFHSFDDKTKLSVALTLAKRAVPQQHHVEGELKVELAERLKQARQRVFEYERSQN